MQVFYTQYLSAYKHKIMSNILHNECNKKNIGIYKASITFIVVTLGKINKPSQKLTLFSL